MSSDPGPRTSIGTRRPAPAVVLFETPEEIAHALCVAPSCYHPRTPVLLRIRPHGRHVGREPFGAGFLATIEVRTELRRLLGLLDEPARTVLLMWFVADQSATSIARRLGISRVHCYRIRDKALREMMDAHRAYTERVDR
jgi:hypothetical protein